WPQGQPRTPPYSQSGRREQVSLLALPDPLLARAEARRPPIKAAGIVVCGLRDVCREEAKRVELTSMLLQSDSNRGGRLSRIAVALAAPRPPGTLRSGSSSRVRSKIEPNRRSRAR